jgi:DNA-binding beta-propeller fold protein YncE
MTTQTQQPTSVRGLYRYHDVFGLLSLGGAGFSNPVAVALGPDGLVYVANRANPNQPDAVRITKCTKEGDYVGEFGALGEGEGEFIWVTDIAFNHKGELALSDEHCHRITIFDRECRFLHRFGQHGVGDGQMDRPSGVAFDSGGNLFVVDALNHRVQVFSLRGRFLTQWGSFGGGEGQFNMPWGIAIDRGDDVYVTDWRNDRVQKFSPEGRFLTAFGSSGSSEGEFNRPNGITVDAGGDIYVCDWMNDRVQVFDSKGNYKDALIGHSGLSKWARTYLDASPLVEEKLNLATQNIEPKMRFYRPFSVQVDDDGMVFVVDGYRHRVQIYQKLPS